MRLDSPDDERRFRLRFVGEAYRLERPQMSEREAVQASVTLASDLYVPACLKDAITGETERQIVRLGSIPLMSSSGTLVINGVSRCVVNQRLTTPGVYYTLNARGTHVATIVSNSGRRVRLELDREGVLSARVTRQDKISVEMLLVCLGGVRIEDISSALECDAEDKEDEDKDKDKNEDEDEDEDEDEHQDEDEDEPNDLLPNDFSHGARCLFQSALRALLASEAARATKRFKRPRRRARRVLPLPNVTLLPWPDIFMQSYDLGVLGRLKFNHSLYAQHTSAPSPSSTRLGALDLILVLQRLARGTEAPVVLDDIDELSHKHVKSVGEVMQEQLRLSLSELNRGVTGRLRRLLRLFDNPSHPGDLPSPQTLLLGSIPLTVAMDPFFGSYALSQFLDQTNPLGDMIHKRRLSSLGPGGLTPRTATFKARDIQPSQYGRVCPVDTAEGQNAGIVTSFTVCAEVDSKGRIKSSLRAVNKVSPRGLMTDVLLASQDEHLRISTGSCLTVIPGAYDRATTSAQRRREFVSTPWGQVHLRCMLPIHHFSVGVTLVPFLEHNDATRALMGSNMQRQAVPLLNPERPIVGTGLEAQVSLDSGAVLTAGGDGRVEYADARSVSLLQEREGLVDSTVRLINFQKANHSTCIHQRPAVHPHQFVRRGQLLADAAATVGGELALGKNVLVAYMPWKGYNFEDAVLISERLVCEDVYTSMHIERYESEARQSVEEHEVITSHIPHINQHLLRHLDDGGVASLGAWVEPGDVLVGRVASQQARAHEADPERRLLRAIFGISTTAHTRETCVKVPLRAGGRVVDVRWVRRESLDRESGELRYIRAVHVFVLQRRKIQVGDKVAGRHGNKGVVSRIVGRQDMPYLQDGTPVDMVLSPLGVPSRMNVGQTLECLLGFSGELLDKHYRIVPFDERYEPEASRKLALSELYHACQATGSAWLFECDSPGKSHVFNGETGDRFEQPVAIGRAYMLKLIHQVDDKIHARSTGPYAMVTQQPLRGRSRQGGQRLGEMEVWALLGFGAAHVLQEMILLKSDHVIARSDTLTAITTGDTVPSPAGAQDSLRLLVRELLCLGININHALVSQRDLTAQPSRM